MFQWHKVPQLLRREPPDALSKSQSMARSVIEESVEHVTSIVYTRSTISSAAKAQHTCGANGSSQCAYDYDSSDETLPIVLGVVIPVVFALAVFAYLHRRYRIKQRLEDANDKHASLDFGLGEVHRNEKEDGHTSEMAMSDPNLARMIRSRGVSLDLNNPYVLPPQLHNSRGSLHSLTRSQDGEGPYRSVHMVLDSGMMGSSRPPTSQSSRPTSQKDNSSVKTRSTDSTSKANLLRYAQKPSEESPQVYSAPNTSPSSSPPTSSARPSDEATFTARTEPEVVVKPAVIAIPAPAFIPERAINPQIPARKLEGPSPRLVREGTDQQGAFVLPPRRESKPATPKLVIPQSPPPTFSNAPVAPNAIKTPSREYHQAQTSSMSGPNGSRTPSVPSSPVVPYDEDLTYADVLGIVQKESRSPYVDNVAQFSPLPTIPEPTPVRGLGVQFGSKRLQAGQRPLPPSDPTDNPDQRANKIRSFYREYFDESNSNNHPYIHGSDYYEGYGQEYLDGAAIYDPETGQFIVAGAPFNSPITRRAMTPPPRAPPRFRNSPAPSGRRSSSTGRSNAQHRDGRVHSSASAQAPGYRGRAPKRQAPTPGPLNTLPTPHHLKDDSASTTEFAPPLSYKDRQAGKQMSPSPALQPWTAPNRRAFSPLASSFDDLPVVPSPHALRKSGSFTALDFAPTHRFRFDGAGSDGGSVRSGHSNISAAQVANIRAGAYRLSRIPKEAVGTRDDFAVSLKPQWNISRG